MERKWVILSLSVLILNLADVAITSLVLSMGGQELNPLFCPYTTTAIAIKLGIAVFYSCWWLVVASILSRHLNSKNKRTRKIAKIGLTIIKIALISTIILYIGVIINNLIVAMLLS
ncbi:MAG: DUF5658 family protein [Candidatus Heimdallarchaeota archaeon]